MIIGRFKLNHTEYFLLEEQNQLDRVTPRECEEHVLIKGYLVDPDQAEERDILDLVNQLHRRARGIAA